MFYKRTTALYVNAGYHVLSRFRRRQLDLELVEESLAQSRIRFIEHNQLKEVTSALEPAIG